MDMWLLILYGPSRELQESAVVIYDDMQELKWAIVAIYTWNEKTHILNYNCKQLIQMSMAIHSLLWNLVEG
jgi:hypothetical protein